MIARSLQRKWLLMMIPLGIVLGACASGCVRRTARFTSVPEGARVFLNDEDIGRTPVTVDFTFYGDYDVLYRLDGYQTVKTHVRIDPPLYQIFPFDFVAEVLWPAELHDHHEIAPQELAPLAPADAEALRQRAVDFRDRTLFEAESDAQASGS